MCKYWLITGIVIGFLIGTILHSMAIQDSARAEFVRNSYSIEGKQQ